MKTISAVVAMTAIAVLLPNCGAGPDGGTKDDEPTATTSSAMSINWSKYYNMPFIGGTGGSNDPGFHCPANAVAVGIYGTTTYEYSTDANDYIESFGVLCETLYSDGTLSTTPTQTYGGGVWGGFLYSSRCPQGDVMIGMEGQATTYVDALQPVCVALSDLFDESYTTAAPRVGGDGGWYFDNWCPRGYVVVNGYVRSGSWVDGLQLTCDQISP